MFGSRTDRDYYLAMADKCEQSAEGSVEERHKKGPDCSGPNLEFMIR